MNWFTLIGTSSVQTSEQRGRPPVPGDVARRIGGALQQRVLVADATDLLTRARKLQGYAAQDPGNLVLLPKPP